MTKSQRVLWGEGMFLRPQHFQQQEVYWDARLALAMRSVYTHPWGVRAVSVDRDALTSGQLRIDALDLTFQDGTSFEAPHLEPLPLARNLDDIPGIGIETYVYACLPLVNAFGGNCSDPDKPTPRPARYYSERTQVADLYTEALESELTVLRIHVRIMLTPENRDGNLCIPIARLVKNATGIWSLDESYIHPVVEIRGAPPILALIRRLLDILMVKSQSLASVHRERVKNVMEFGTSDIASFWLLYTVNRNYPLLSHLLNFPRAHPEELYKTLAQFAGELLTFSSNLTLNDIPPYKHEDLGPSLQRFDTLLRELLETVISSRYAVIPLISTRPSFFVGRLDSDHLIEGADFYLSVSSEQPAASILDAVPLRLKVGSPDDVEKILNSALPGVRLMHVIQTPAAVPMRIGNHYFALEPQGIIFDRMMKSRSICIYVPQALAELKLELISVFRR